MKVPCVICFGQTLMIAAAGESHLVVLVTLSVKTSPKLSTTTTA